MDRAAERKPQWPRTRPWTPALPAFAAAAILFGSFARPDSWLLPGGQRITLADGSFQVTWRGSKPMPLLGGIPILGPLFGPRPARFTNWWFAFEFQGPSP